jgi:spore germination protein GerM
MIPRQPIATAAVLLMLAIAMGIYLIRLEREQTSVPVELHQAGHVSPPLPSAAMQTITVWVADDDAGALRPQSVAVPVSSAPQQRAEDVLQALLKIYLAPNSPHRVGAGSEVRAVYLANPGLAVIDVNSAFADEQTSGVLAEELTLASFAQTLSTNVPGLLRVKFLVEGKDRDTLAGHADLTGYYDVSDFSQLAKQLTAD